jgi:hypothetical protein
MVDGRNTIGQIAQRSSLGEFRTCEIIAQLLQSGLIENRTLSPGEVLAPEFERIAGSVLGTGAAAVLQESYKQASVFDPSRATSDQMSAVVDYFEMRATPIIGADRASKAAGELRARMQEVLG